MELTTQPQKQIGPGDLYGRLGISPDATQEEVRKAYQRAAAKYHPDKGGDPEAFKAIKRAYETLIDPDKRQAYDATGIFEGEDAAKVEIARGLVRERVGGFLDDDACELEYVDIVAAVKRGLRGNAKTCRESMAYIKKAIKRLTKNRNRAKAGLIRSVFDIKIAALEKALETVGEDIEMLGLAMKLIDTCGYEYDEKPAPETPRPTGYFSFDPGVMKFRL